MFESDSVLYHQYHLPRRCRRARLNYGKFLCKPFQHKAVLTLHSGSNDVLWLFLQYLGPIAGISDSRTRRCTEMAKGLARFVCLFLPAMGGFHGFDSHMAKVRFGTVW